MQYVKSRPQLDVGLGKAVPLLLSFQVALLPKLLLLLLP